MSGTGKQAIWICAALLMVPRLVQAQGRTLTTLRRAFAAELEKTAETRREKLGKLNGIYTESLTKLRKKAQADGNLDALVALQTETKRFAEEGTLTDRDLSNTSAELRKLQGGFLASRQRAARNEAESVVALAENYEAALAARQAKLTREGELEEALAVKKERTELSSHPGVSAAKFALADAESRRPPSPPRTRPKPDSEPTTAQLEAAVRRRHRTFYQSISMRSTGAAMRYVLPKHAKEQRAAVTARLKHVIDLVSTVQKAGFMKHLTDPPEVNLKGSAEASIPTPFVQSVHGTRENPPSRWVLVDDKWYIDVFSN